MSTEAQNYIQSLNDKRTKAYEQSRFDLVEKINKTIEKVQWLEKINL